MNADLHHLYANQLNDDQRLAVRRIMAANDYALVLGKGR